MNSSSLLDKTVILSAIYIKVYKSFEPAYLSFSLIGAYYCVGLDCVNTKIEKT